jgi:IS4 transposase
LEKKGRRRAAGGGDRWWLVVLDGEKQLGFRGGVLDWRGEQVIFVGFGAKRRRMVGYTDGP